MNIGFRSLGSDIALNILRHIGKLVLGLGLFVLLARVLGPEGNGEYSVAILVPTLLSTFLNLGIPPANVYYVGREDVSVRTAMWTSLILWAGLSVAGLLVGILIVVFRAEQWFPSVPPLLLWITLFSFPAVLLEKLFLGLLQSVQDFERYNVAMLVAPTVTLAAAVVLVWGMNSGTLGAIFAFGGGYLVGATVAGFNVRPHLEEEQEDEEWRSYVRTCIGYGWKAHLSNVLAFVNYRADLYLVNYFVSPAAAGIYVIAIRVAERMWILSKAVSTVILPRLAEMHGDEEKRKYLTPLISRWVLIVSIGACVGLGLIADPAIPWVFGQEYAEAVDVLYWFLPGIIIGSVARILANDIAARGHPELNLYTSFATVSANVVANVILIPEMGVTGGAIATTFAYSLNGGLKVWLYTYLSGNRWWASFLVSSEDWRLLQKVWATLMENQQAQSK